MLYAIICNSVIFFYFVHNGMESAKMVQVQVKEKLVDEFKRVAYESFKCKKSGNDWKLFNNDGTAFF